MNRGGIGRAAVVFVWIGAGLWSMAIAAPLLPPSSPHLSPGPEHATESPPFVRSWILVRLKTPLSAQDARQDFALSTGRSALDDTIAESGVNRIVHAIPNSMRESPNPARLRRHGLDRTYRFHVPEGSDVLEIVARFERLPEVDYAEPDYLGRRAAVIPDDALFLQQWGLHQGSDADVDAPEGWESSTGEGVVIAVLDTGIDSDHEDLVCPGKIVQGYDFFNDDPDPEDDDLQLSHGTRVSSIATACTNNGIGLAGTCWGCGVMPVKILEGDSSTTSIMVDGLVWATDHGARVVNSSWSWFDSPTLIEGLGYAYDAGVTVVASSGNQDQSTITFPARYVETLAVGASDALDQRAAFSNHGARLDVVAPGVGIWAATIDGDYSPDSGTSYSAPMVAGIAGLIQTVYPSVGREGVRHLVRSGAEDQPSADPDDTPGFDPHYGWGRVNVDRTLIAASSATTLRVVGKAATRLYLETPNPLADSYDFVRGDLDSLNETWQGVDLGAVSCLDDDSPDPDTIGNEDTTVPDPGKGFFYLTRFDTPAGTGSYGGSSRNRDRRVLPRPSWTRSGGQDGAELGYAVGGAGDVNNDGYDDVIIGAPGYTDDQTSEGGAFLYLGSSDGLQTEPAWIAPGNQSGSGFGTSVALAGDVDGDGYDDVIVGAPFHSNGHTQEGRAYVFLGSATGPGLSADWIVESNQASSRFGERVASAGDVDGDGYADVLVTAPQFDAGQNNEGRAFLYFGSASGLGTVPWTFETNQSGARLGFGGGTAGDVNGDGYDDLVIGAHRYSGPEVDEGRVFLFLGSPSGPMSPPTTLEIDVPGARLGRAAATAGDVNGDGYDDIIIGAVFYSDTESQEGGVFVFTGSSAGISTVPAWSVASGQRTAHLGTAAATAGDVNGDGYGDVIVGADAFDSRRSNEGGAWVHLGSSTGLAEAPHWIGFGGQPNAWFGWAVGCAGNVDGDESPSGNPYDEIIVGAYGYDENSYGEGHFRVYRGSATGLPRTTDCGE